jgi:hypothetical protein
VFKGRAVNSQKRYQAVKTGDCLKFVCEASMLPVVARMPVGYDNDRSRAFWYRS